MTGMKECAHEREVLDLVLSERWPDRCDPDMVAHAATCDACRDVVAVAVAMREDEARAQAEVIAASPHHQSVVPDATLVWWRAQLRAHEDAARKAARPIAMVQGIGIGIGLVAAISFGRVSWPWIRAYLVGASSGFTDLMARSAAASGAAIAAAPLWLTISIAAALVAAPVAVYAALGRD
jgi:hypothetical protein